MTPESVGPLSRPVSVVNLPETGLSVVVEATAEERAALAADFALEAIDALTGEFRLTGSTERVRVVGRIDARIRQTCVVTLEPFDSAVSEAVEVEFASGARATAGGGPDGLLDDVPDPLPGTHVDLGALTAEFLALGLDPHARKPGVDFAFDSGEDAPESPFAALKGLKPQA